MVFSGGNKDGASGQPFFRTSVYFFPFGLQENDWLTLFPLRRSHPLLLIAFSLQLTINPFRQ